MYQTFPIEVVLTESIRSSWLWDDAEKLRWWLDLRLMERNGCVRATLAELTKRWATYKMAVKRFLERLQSDGLVSVETSTGRNSITTLRFGAQDDEEEVAEQPKEEPQLISEEPKQQQEEEKPQQQIVPVLIPQADDGRMISVSRSNSAVVSVSDLARWLRDDGGGMWKEAAAMQLGLHSVFELEPLFDEYQRECLAQGMTEEQERNIRGHFVNMMRIKFKKQKENGATKSTAENNREFHEGVMRLVADTLGYVN